MPARWQGRRFVSIQELERMSPAERQASFEDALVMDAAEVPDAFRNLVRERFAAVVAERDREQASVGRERRDG